MSDPTSCSTPTSCPRRQPRSRRTLALFAATIAVLIVASATLGFLVGRADGSSTAPKPSPTTSAPSTPQATDPTPRPTTPMPTTNPPTTAPNPTTPPPTQEPTDGCNIFDPECGGTGGPTGVEG
ncbi:hypothetical protein [Streptomyces sp. NPDC088707]|uniref:hypothetical protein n=1 Tax=Streptomyces sp. NPDC088707 TaxID=3365871 RepID=UPI0037F7D8A9